MPKGRPGDDGFGTHHAAGDLVARDMHGWGDVGILPVDDVLDLWVYRILDENPQQVVVVHRVARHIAGVTDAGRDAIEFIMLAGIRQVDQFLPVGDRAAYHLEAIAGIEG